MKLEGKVALITGSGSGIGRATALYFAGEGADIVVNDVNLAGAEETAAEVKKLGRKAIAVKADVSEESQVKAMMERAIKEMGGINILMNIAGVEGFGPLLDTSVETWDRVQAVNLRGTFLCCKHAGRWMIDSKQGGKIINISSLACMRCPPNMVAYAASKAAIVRLTATLSLEWNPYGIYVNCIIPGGIDTPMSRAHGPANPDRIKMLIPLGRIGQPVDIAKVAFFLACDLSDYVSGIAIPVDGGETARF